MNRRRYRLTTLGPIIISALLILVFVAIYIVSSNAGAINIQEGLDDVSLPVLTTTSKLLFNPLYTLDVTRISSILDPYVDGTSIVYAAVYNEKGTQIVEINKGWSPDGLLSQQLSSQALALKDIARNEVDDYLILAKPIAAGTTQIGTVEIVFNQAPLKESLGRAQATISTTLIVALVLTTLLFFFLFQIAIRPLNRLTFVAQQISRGDTSVEIPLAGSEEIFSLATTLGQLVESLRSTISTLELRVDERTKALATTGEVSRRISNITNQQQLAVEVVTQLQSAFNYYHAHIYFLNEAGDTLIMAGGTGEAGKTLLAGGHSISIGRGLVGRAAESKQVVLVADTSKAEGWLPNPLLPETKAEIAVPIVAGDQVYGVLDVQNNVAGSLTQQDSDMISSIANQVGIGLQNIRQFQNTQKMASDLGVVATVGIATSTITEADRLLQEVVELAKKSFNLYHAHIYLINEAKDTLVLAAGAGEAGRTMVADGRSIPVDQEKSLVARAARTQAGVVVNDVKLDPDFLPNPLLPNTRSELAVPMIAGGEVIGVLDVQGDAPNRFTETDVNIQTTLAAQVAVALQNAKSFIQTRQQAERETALNLIGQRIQSTTTVDAALQIAVRELGHALGMKPAMVTISASSARDRKGDQ